MYTTIRFALLACVAAFAAVIVSSGLYTHIEAYVCGIAVGVIVGMSVAICSSQTSTEERNKNKDYEGY